MASGSHSFQAPWWGPLGEEVCGSEEKGKKVKLNPWKHSWLARRRKFLFACVVGLPLTRILLKGHIFFWLGCILRMCQLWINRACANSGLYWFCKRERKWRQLKFFGLTFCLGINISFFRCNVCFTLSFFSQILYSIYNFTIKCYISFEII